MLPSLSLLGCDDVIPEYISFPIASFKLSRDLLRSSVVCCPSIYLGRTLDLINGSETVLSVYDRVEGVNKVIINSVSQCEIISGVISDGSFARYEKQLITSYYTTYTFIYISIIMLYYYFI